MHEFVGYTFYICMFIISISAVYMFAKLIDEIPINIKLPIVAIISSFLVICWCLILDMNHKRDLLLERFKKPIECTRNNQ